MFKTAEVTDYQENLVEVIAWLQEKDQDQARKSETSPKKVLNNEKNN